ncbi:Hypothetical predicted protein [Paramuricea clavata]|uniref:Uncharacterized protein n=1 Tax=Paramuricea clavata TaxID=317549 RepID=A0A7D9DXN5_PARCT|nr:Hypothetical predicted protein [Paramuricea clavata]
MALKQNKPYPSGKSNQLKLSNCTNQSCFFAHCNQSEEENLLGNQIRIVTCEPSSKYVTWSSVKTPSCSQVLTEEIWIESLRRIHKNSKELIQGFIKTLLSKTNLGEKKKEILTIPSHVFIERIWARKSRKF